MILYCDTVKNFIDKCQGTNPSIGQTLLDKFKENNLGGRGTSEYNSWIHSLPKVADALKDESIPQDAYVSVEYGLSGTKQRVDFLIYGKDENDIENVVLIELKQWSSVKRSSLKDYVNTDGGHGPDDYWHPSYQAYNYANIMKYFNEYIYTNHVVVNACSYLHNMPEGYESILNDENAYSLIQKYNVPCFLKDDQKKLTEFISKYIKKPYKQTLYEIDGSRIKPSEGFSKMVFNAIKGNPFYSYDAEQSYSVAKIVNEVQEALSKGERRTLIIKGGPGSGKSLVAINALGQLLNPSDGNERRNACYVTANFTPRTYFGDVLADDFKKKAIKELFKSPKSFATSTAYDYDCIIVDEAHRMLKWKYGWGIRKEVDAIDKLFNASRVNIFMIDEDQVVTASDDLSIKQIKEYAQKYGSKVIEDNRMILSSQFRCVGGERYIDFINKLLGYTNNFVSVKQIPYKIKIMDSMTDMMMEWEDKWESGHEFRLMAGYTHNWCSKKNPGAYDFNYDNGKVRLKWNLRSKNHADILDPAQKGRVFGLHAIQGLESEYAGVIIGKDLTYNKEKGCIEFHQDRVTTESQSGIKNAAPDFAERLIRNTYKVLLTRGVKGTYIHAEDDDLREYLKTIVRY